MSGRPTRSSRLLILHLCQVQYLISEMRIKALDRMHFHFMSQKLTQVKFHPGQCNQTHPHTRSKLYQHVHIAVAPEIVAQYRPEEGQSPNVIPLTEFGDLHLRHVNLHAQCAPPRSTWPVLRASGISVLVSVSTMVPSTIARRAHTGAHTAPPHTAPTRFSPACYNAKRRDTTGTNERPGPSHTKERPCPSRGT